MQAQDPELQAIAGLTSAADRLPYFTGSGTAALATFTSFARTLVDDADATAAKVTLGLVIGTNVQAWDADLDAIAALAPTNDDIIQRKAGAWTNRTMAQLATDLAATNTWQPLDSELTALAGVTSGADKLPYFTGSGTATVTDLTSAARTVLDDTTVGAMLTTLGGQPLDADLTTIAGLTATTDNFMQAKSSAWASRTVAQVSVDLQATGLITDAVGFRTIPQNSQSAAYTTVAADSGKHILHPSGDANARTFTIDSNANVAYPVGTAITFVNQTSQVVTIAITSDTLTLAGTTTSGSRSLAQNGVATALKITSTIWVISGTGLT